MTFKEKYIKYKKKYLDYINYLKQINKQMGGSLKYFVVTIGSFIQKSDKMFVSDPSYEFIPEEHEMGSKLMKLNLVIPNVLAGTYDVILRIKTNEREKNAELVCIHQSFLKDNGSMPLYKYPWEKQDDEIGVDTGQAGIYDLKYYGENEENGNNDWFEMNTRLTAKPTDYAGAMEHGAVSTAGNGDGIYPVYVIKNDSKIVGIKIVFID